MLSADILFEWWKQVEDIWTLTIFDLDKIPDELNDQDIVYYIKEYLWYWFISLDMMNQLYQDAIIYLKYNLFFSESELRTLDEKVFESMDQIVEFILWAKRKRWRINCTIIKTILALNEWSEKYNHRISEVVEKTRRVVDNKLLNSLIILDESEDWSDVSWVAIVNWREISFTMKKRAKSDSSRIAKWIKDPNYQVHEFLSDEYGVTFELDNKWDIPIFMEYIAQSTFKRGVYDIKNKWMLSIEDIENNTEISEGFKDKLLSAKNTKKSQSADDYSDIKITTPYYKWDNTKNLSLEIKFVVSENSNEKWLSMQWVYDYMKRIDQRIRLEWFVSREYIERVVEMFFTNLGTILYNTIWRENKDEYEYKKELFNDLKRKWFIDGGFNLNQWFVQQWIDNFLRSWLALYYRDLLRPVKVWRSQDKNKYYTNSRWVKIGGLELWDSDIEAQD